MFESVKTVISPYVSRGAVCQGYDPRAADVAREIAALVYDHLPQIRPEHVGSTAVPGCDGTGVVDLLVPVPDGAMETVEELLDRLGFQRHAGPEPSAEDRLLRVGSWAYEGQTFLVHLHVMGANSPAADEMRFFRACLKADAELVKAYVARKREIIAAGVTDCGEYCQRKGEFIRAMLG
jgi:GrpB-like predicted nucleotidyltransferase (UPF0157 family)